MGYVPGRLLHEIEKPVRKADVAAFCEVLWAQTE
jgi:hypothetical protein